jgi:arginine deiminase
MLFTRDSRPGGVTPNPVDHGAAAGNLLTSTRHHPAPFAQADFAVWWGDPDVNHGPATLEGGDIMPIGQV